jgi:glycosyltransferase involved in cell wall biosynthesis
MKLSVVIPCYNAEDTISEQLDALSQQNWIEPWEIIVADNRCTDNSMEIVRRYQEKLPNLRIVDASDRQGQPYALNVGAEAADGEALTFCDADDVVGDGWVSAMGSALSEHDFVACRIDIKKLNKIWVQMSHGNPQEHGLNVYRYPPYLPHGGGGTLGVKKVLYQIIGGFDESLPILHDTDFCWRLQRSGTKLHFVPGAVMHIRYRDAFRGIYRQAIGYAEYNVLLYKRYRPLGMPKLQSRAVVDAWLNLLKRLYRIRSKGDLAAWIWLYGWRLGRLKGCIKHSVMAP